MKFETLCIGKTKDATLSKITEEYCKRLNHYTSFSHKSIREPFKGKNRPARAMEEEGRLLLGSVERGSYLIALDSTGVSMDSEGFADCISRLERRSCKKVVFLIGGPDGLAEEVKKAADMLLSLSKMTFTHDMVRLFLVEQLYRAFTIKAGEKYHK